MTDALRQQLIDTAMAMNDSGLNQGTSGNLSVRYDDGFLITPSGMDYTGLSPDEIVWMDFAGNSRGRRKPSSEWHFHAAIYQHHEEANAVLHAHPVSCTALACLDKGIPAFHYMVSMAGGKDIRCAHYATLYPRAFRGCTHCVGGAQSLFNVPSWHDLFRKRSATRSGSGH